MIRRLYLYELDLVIQIIIIPSNHLSSQPSPKTIFFVTPPKSNSHTPPGGIRPISYIQVEGLLKLTSDTDYSEARTAMMNVEDIDGIEVRSVTGVGLLMGSRHYVAR